jgi:Glycosyltransferase family 87/WD40-like Beta Propeller Repeat
LQETAHDSRVLATVEWFFLLGLLAAFMVKGFVPAWKTLNTDFPNYYVAASIHRQGIPLDRAYEWRWFQRQKDHQQVGQSLVGFAPHPPMCALPMLPLTGLSALNAKRVWLLLNLGLLAVVMLILRKVTRLSWAGILVLTFLCMLPLRANFLFGQYYVVILMLLCGAYYAAHRGWRFTSGGLLAVAASLKIFPAFFLILFLRKRNWRAVAGMVATGAALMALSITIFGWSVHKIYLLEVLPRAMRGDLLGPYTLQWNSFTAICHRLFLAEPELNPSPLLNSPAVYALAQAILATILLFSFLLNTSEDDTPQASAWEWATFMPLLLLLSSMPSHYHYCILIFTAIVAVDWLLKTGRWRSAAGVVLLFAIACCPVPGSARLNLPMRLTGLVFLYVLLLWVSPSRTGSRAWKLGSAVAVVFLALLTFSNLRAQRNRSEDFSRRLVSSGLGTFSVARAGDRLVFDEMADRAYAMVVGVLSIAAGPQSPYVYFELTGRRSQIFRLPVPQIGRPDSVPQYFAEGHDPAMSVDGHWLVYLREENSQTIILLSENGAPALPVHGFEKLSGVLEMTVTAEGNLIVASGGAADPHLFRVDTATGEVGVLSEIDGAVRYPAISPDGKHLAFSRRESGSWHLYVRDLASGAERQLTSAACNATSPSWEDSESLLYVSDCGRTLGLSAPVRTALKFAP